MLLVTISNPWIVMVMSFTVYNNKQPQAQTTNKLSSTFASHNTHYAIKIATHASITCTARAEIYYLIKSW